MKLTKYDREAFVRAAMDDVPQVDYSAMAKKAWEETVTAHLPFELLNAITRHPAYFDANTVVMPQHISNFHSRLQATNWNSSAWARDYPALSAALTELMRGPIAEWDAASYAQKRARAALDEKLTAAIGACSTLKQALDLLPEFAKYLPQDRDGKITRSMPVVANLVADLMAAGWPKGKASPAPQ